MHEILFILFLVINIKESNEVEQAGGALPHANAEPEPAEDQAKIENSTMVKTGEKEEQATEDLQMVEWFTKCIIYNLKECKILRLIYKARIYDPR